MFGCSTNHIALATLYNNLGLCYDFMGEFKLAMEYHERCINIRLAQQGTTHPGQLWLSIPYGLLLIFFLFWVRLGA